MYKIFTAPEKEATKYSDVIVDGRTALIVGSNGQFVKEQADEVLFWLPETLPRSYHKGSTPEEEEHKRTELMDQRAQELHAERKSLTVLDPDVNYIYMAHPFSRIVYGHLFDSLQRLYHAIPAAAEPWKVLHSSGKSVVEFETHLEKLGVPADCLIELDKNEAVVVPNLWVSPWQEWPAALTLDTYDWIYQRYTEKIPKTDAVRLYLSRNHVRSSQRGVTNEDEVLARLEPLGFQIFLGTESVDQMLSMFHNAEMIIAPHGSALANTMFCSEGCQILEFCPDNRIDHSFERKHKKAKAYKHVLCPGDDDFNISIPMDEIELFLLDFQNLSILEHYTERRASASF